METRATKLTQTSPQQNKLEGYAATFDNPTTITDVRGRAFQEVIRAGAFTDAIATGDVRALLNHDHNKLLGRQKSGTLRLEERPDGLWFSIDLPDTEAAREVRELVKRGDLDGCSFGWTKQQVTWSTRDKKPTRELVVVGLEEISICSFPAYQNTSCELRCSGLWQMQLKILRARIDTI